MKIIYFYKDQKLHAGVVTKEGVRLLSGSLVSLQRKEHLERLITSKVSEAFIQNENLEIASCVLNPSNIICIGLNYRKHAAESGMAVPSVPVAFTKYNNTLIDFGKDVTLSQDGVEYDYEVELGVIIGKECKRVSEKEALDHVLGYCVANDLSCRDLQFKTSQWLIGKSLDGFLPLGNYLVTADEIGDPQSLQLKCTVNGELRQNSNTSDMIFSVAEIIAFLSRYMTLLPGDLILTGTPEGVAMGMPEKKWLKPGDVVKVEIEKLGYTENRMVN
jgi:2-keto-4-pentenoate hydratase/2-oxohepta-3-ene-1,7-dioic acid hydratase in catechol pathway